jgi:hypothetical protein
MKANVSPYKISLRANELMKRLEKKWEVVLQESKISGYLPLTVAKDFANQLHIPERQLSVALDGTGIKITEVNGQAMVNEQEFAQWVEQQKES